jgi:hypothetical protein
MHRERREGCSILPLCQDPYIIRGNDNLAKQYCHFANIYREGGKMTKSRQHDSERLLFDVLILARSYSTLFRCSNP